jgi:hypothetical protein
MTLDMNLEFMDSPGQRHGYRALITEAMGKLVLLRDLEVVCGYHRDQNPTFECPSLSRFLEALPLPNAVTQVKFLASFGKFHPSVLKGRSFWDDIDQILCNRSRFPALRTLDFHFTLNRKAPLDKPATEEYEEEEQAYWTACKGVGVRVNFSYAVRLYR